MRFTVITPNFNGALYLEETIKSVLAQKDDVELEYILVDGDSSDGSSEIIDRYRDAFDHCIIEKDNGPADAINKGFLLATGDVVSWLNSDDIYYPGTLGRVQEVMKKYPDASMCFGGCTIMDEQGHAARSSITGFKEFFYPFSSRFTYQCINYISQPALFFAGEAVKEAGPLREDMVAAWDYEFILRLWHEGDAKWLQGEPLSAFRWHEQSISGQNYSIQFKEEYDAARNDAGLVSLQTFIHLLVRWGIVGAYSAMAIARSLARKDG